MLGTQEKAPSERVLRGAVFRSQRESSETFILNAFCRVAPRLRLSVLAIFGAGVFDLAIVFSSLTSCVVPSRRFDTFLAIMPPLGRKWGFKQLILMHLQGLACQLERAVSKRNTAKRNIHSFGRC